MHGAFMKSVKYARVGGLSLELSPTNQTKNNKLMSIRPIFTNFLASIILLFICKIIVKKLVIKKNQKTYNWFEVTLM